MATSLKTIKLTLGEIYALEAEINGATNPQTGEKTFKGILANPISMLQRYWLTELSELIAKDKKSIDKMRDDLILKLGEAGENGAYSLPTFIDKLDEDGEPVKTEDGKSTVKEFNPKFVEFNNEMNTLLAEEKDIEHYPFSIEAFDFETDESYPVFFKLLKTKKEEALEPTL
jgi:hypothetical protein